MKTARIIYALPLALVALLPAQSADYGPGTVVGKVTDASDRKTSRKIQVDAGGRTWTLHFSETDRVVHAGRLVSVHDIDEGMWVKARGRRIGALRLRVSRADIIGDGIAYRRSGAYRRSSPRGYFVARHLK